MRPAVRAIDINALARKVEVDHRIPLSYYYRIAANLLKQANIYREEKNLIDLYIILLRFSSLMCETIPSHGDFQFSLPKERAFYKKKLLDVINELELLKPVVYRQVDEINKKLASQSYSEDRPSNSPTPPRKQILPASRIEQVAVRGSMQSLLKYSDEQRRILPNDQVQTERQLQKLSLNLPRPKEETLSRHSILGPNGLGGQWRGPVTGIRIEYPSNFDLTGTSDQKQDAHYCSIVTAEVDSKKCSYDMETVLSLDDGRWSIPVEDSGSFVHGAPHEDFSLLNIRQPSPPPVLAQVRPDLHTIPHQKVADPRPGPAKASKDGMPNGYKKLQIPVNMMESFLRLAQKNTEKNMETCGVLGGTLRNSTFYVTTLIIPKQQSTSDSCQTTDEEEIFNVQEKLSLFALGWIHTHPTQTCFMSSIDLHTHYAYQIMLPEAIAIVMAPTDSSRSHGIFHLTDPSGVTLIRNCQERGFHPHEEPADGSPIYEFCSHVFLSPTQQYDVIDLRNS